MQHLVLLIVYQHKKATFPKFPETRFVFSTLCSGRKEKDAKPEVPEPVTPSQRMRLKRPRTHLA